MNYNFFNYNYIAKDIINTISLKSYAANLYSIKKQIKDAHILKCEKLVF